MLRRQSHRRHSSWSQPSFVSVALLLFSSSLVFGRIILNARALDARSAHMIGGAAGALDVEPGGDDADVAEGALDVDALDLLAAPDGSTSSEVLQHMAMMRERKARKAAAKAKATEKSTVATCKSKLADVASLAPSAARAAGIAVTRRFKAGSECTVSSALALMRVGFGGSSRTMAEKRHNFGHQVDHFLTKLLLSRQRVVISVLCHAAKALKDLGYTVFLGFNYEHDAAKMTMKCVTGLLADSIEKHVIALEERAMKERHRGQKRHFQAARTHTIVNMGGQVILRAFDGIGSSQRNFHWVSPPLALSADNTAAVATYLAKMPIRVDQSDDLKELSNVADVVLCSGCQDKAGVNVAFTSHVKEVFQDLPTNCLVEDEWCQLHSTNNLKVGSKDVCALSAKYYSLAALMKSNDYMIGGIRRLAAWVEDVLVRHEMLGPNAG